MAFIALMLAWPALQRPGLAWHAASCIVCKAVSVHHVSLSWGLTWDLHGGLPLQLMQLGQEALAGVALPPHLRHAPGSPLHMRTISTCILSRVPGTRELPELLASPSTSTSAELAGSLQAFTKMQGTFDTLSNVEGLSGTP